MLARCKLPCVCFAPARPRPPCFGRAADSHSAWPWALAVAVGSLLDLVPCTRVLCGDSIQTPYFTKGCAHVKVNIVGFRPKDRCDHGPGSRFQNTGPLVDVGRSRLLLASPVPKTSAVNNEKKCYSTSCSEEGGRPAQIPGLVRTCSARQAILQATVLREPWAYSTRCLDLASCCVLILGAKLLFSRCYPTSCLEEGGRPAQILGHIQLDKHFFQKIFFFGSAGGKNVKKCGVNKLKQN